jgi:hypothetical protein
MQWDTSVIKLFGFQRFLNPGNQKKPENVGTWKPMSDSQETSQIEMLRKPRKLTETYETYY